VMTINYVNGLFILKSRVSDDIFLAFSAFLKTYMLSPISKSKLTCII
jgi:hypothetical protein